MRPGLIQGGPRDHKAADHKEEVDPNISLAQQVGCAERKCCGKGIEVILHVVGDNPHGRNPPKHLQRLKFHYGRLSVGPVLRTFFHMRLGALSTERMRWAPLRKKAFGSEDELKVAPSDLP
ncbi:protein of unknown function [Cupriavidus taiwanensis]|uniref:Uncharacterized protein n=1 Tax=Cupriavidus taiwanensis TaxID=164546 RepID=A0A375IDG4_9BURK|nr:protein of unknown function [Cupriavidus taiwanensis]